MKKDFIVLFLVFSIMLSTLVFAQQATRRPPAIDAAKSSISLPGKSTTAYGWHGGAAGSSASPKSKLSRPTDTKSVSGVRASWKSTSKLTGHTGFSRHTPTPSNRGPKNAITGNLVKRPSSQMAKVSNRARYAKSPSKTIEGNAASASNSFEGSASSGQNAGSISGAGTSSGSGARTSTPTAAQK